MYPFQDDGEGDSPFQRFLRFVQVCFAKEPATANDRRTGSADQGQRANRPRAPESRKQQSRRRPILICGLVAALCLVMWFFGSTRDSQIPQREPTTLEIGGIKIGDSLDGAKQHGMEVYGLDANKTRGDIGHKTIKMDAGQIDISYSFFDSKVVNIQLRFPSYCYDDVAKDLSEKFGRPSYVGSEKDYSTWPVKLPLTSKLDGYDSPNNTDDFVLMNRPSGGYGTGFLSSHQFRGSGLTEQEKQQEKDAIKKQL